MFASRARSWCACHVRACVRWCKCGRPTSLADMRADHSPEPGSAKADRLSHLASPTRRHLGPGSIGRFQLLRPLVLNPELGSIQTFRGRRLWMRKCIGSLHYLTAQTPIPA